MLIRGDITLRPHQVRYLEANKAAYRQGARAILDVCPTGGGKTIIGCAMVDSAVSVKGRRVGWVTGTRELVSQSAAEVGKVCGADAVGFFAAGRPSNPRAPIQVISVQTFASREEVPSNLDILIFDEAHHCAAETWGGLWQRCPNVELVMGFTATPQRGDGLGLGRSEGSRNGFDAMVIETSIQELTRLGILVPCTVIAPNIDKVGPLSKTVLETLQSHGAPGKVPCTVIFMGSVKEAYQQTEIIKRAGYSVACVEGSSDISERKRAIAAHKAGDLEVLVNVQALTEGWDNPRCSLCILARGCTNASTYLQIVGRVLRAFPGKTRAVLEDLTGVVWKHRLPESERKFTLHGNGIETEKRVSLAQCKTCGGVWLAGTIKCKKCGSTLAQPRPPRQVKQAETSVVTESRVLATMEMKRAAYFRLVREAKDKGYQPGWAKIRYQVRFKEWPNAEVIYGGQA